MDGQVSDRNALDRQASFAGGEVSPECYGRTDIATYKQALKLCKNFIPRRHGALVNRPGTKYVATCLAPTSGPPPRLIPFVFSDGQAFVLEFGDQYFHVYQNGAQVLSDGGPAWNSATAYAQYAVVSYSGTTYLSQLDAAHGNTNKQPTIYPAYWAPISNVEWSATHTFNANDYCTVNGLIYLSLLNSNTGNDPAYLGEWWALVSQFPDVLSVATPWSINDVARLKYSQVGDVIVVCHPDYVPQSVSRLSNYSWTVAATILAPPAWPFPQLTSPSIPTLSIIGGGAPAKYLPTTPSYSHGDRVYYTDPSTATNPGGGVADYILTVGAGLTQPPAQYPTGTTGPLAAPSVYWGLDTWSAATQYGPGQYVWRTDISADGNQGALYLCIKQNTNQDPLTATTYWSAASDASHPVTSGSWAVTADLVDSFGNAVESMPAFWTPPGGVFPRFPDRPLAIQFNFSYINNYIVNGWNIYFGDNGILGLVGVADATATFYVDLGAAPDFNTPPPAGTNPFEINNAGAISYSYPGVVAHFQQRRIFARSDAKPSTFWGSAINNFLDFDQPTFITDNDSFEFQIADSHLQEIRNILPQRELFINSGSSEWVASGSNGGVGGAITPSSIDIRSSSNHGISYLDAILIDREVLDITSKGNFIRKLTYDWRTANYIGTDISSLIRHLLDGYTIIDWFYAEVPDSLIYIMRSDGNMLVLTYDPAFEVTAYSQHTTNAAILGNTQGKFKAGCAVPEGTEDRAYFVMQRGSSYFIEEMASRFIDGPNGIGDVRQAVFLDCALQYNGRNTGGPSSVAIVDLVSQAPQIVVNINSTPFVPGDAGAGHEVVLRPDGVPQPGVDEAPGVPLPPVKLRIVAYVNSGAVVCELDTPAPADWTPYTNTTDWAIARTTFAGLDMLDGEQVGALVDGVADNLAQNGATVVGGQVTLTNAGVDVTIGLPYFSDLQTLDVAADQAKTNYKQVSRVTVEVAASRAMLAGETFASLSAADPRQLADNYGTPSLVTGGFVIPIANSWNIGGSVCVRMQDPLPVTIVGLVREVVVGGRG